MPKIVLEQINREDIPNLPDGAIVCVEEHPKRMGSEFQLEFHLFPFRKNTIEDGTVRLSGRAINAFRPLARFMLVKAVSNG